MKVSECMRSDVPYLTVPGTREDLLQLMAETQASGFPICKKGTKTVVGVITRNDLLRKPDENQLGMLMVRDPVIVSPDADIKKAVDLMLEKGFRRIPVVKSGELVGVISIPDILGCILEEEEEYQTATIADYVNRTVVSVWEQTPLILSYMIMEMAGKNAIIIVDDTGRLAGMISVSDYIRLSEVSVEDNVSKTYSGTEHSVEWGWTSKDYLMVTKKLLRLPDIPVREAMTKNIISVSEVSTISDCVKILRKNEIDEAPVVSAAGLLTGIIEDRELLKLAAKRIAPVQKTER
ncbi:MAG: CBS domain-containing protein [Candidatus Thorarchaeota archaeon]|nr:MAG: CBS domain-containing protein [Candidatus Thorarchaeota archaeon]